MERRRRMSQDAMDTSCREERAYPLDSQSTPAEQAFPASLRREAACDTQSVAALASRCLLELGNYQRGELCDETYGLELLRRATLQGDPEAWVWVQHCFHELAHGSSAAPIPRPLDHLAASHGVKVRDHRSRRIAHPADSCRVPRGTGTQALQHSACRMQPLSSKKQEMLAQQGCSVNPEDTLFPLYRMCP